MKYTKTDIILTILGIYFIILGFLALFNSLFTTTPAQVFWMCYLSIFIIGVGILTRKAYIIMSQVYILAIPFLFWDVDFLYRLITGTSLFGLTDYFFVSGSNYLGRFISLQHLYTIPVAIYAVTRLKLNHCNAWIASFVQITLVYTIVKLVSRPETNINCAFYPCFPLDIGLPYRITWFIIFFTMTLLSAIIIHNVPFLSRRIFPASHPKH